MYINLKCLCRALISVHMRPVRLVEWSRGKIVILISIVANCSGLQVVVFTGRNRLADIIEILDHVVPLPYKHSSGIVSLTYSSAIITFVSNFVPYLQ